MLPSNLNNKDIFFNASVAELRRKAQEHSEALLKNIQSQQQKIADIPFKPKDANETSMDKSSSIVTNGNILSTSSIPTEKNTSTSSIKTASLQGTLPIDFPKFPPHNYISALSNFGFPGLQGLPDIHAHSPGLNPRFASNLANLMEKTTSNDSHIKNINDIIGTNSSVVKAALPAQEDNITAASSDSNLKSLSSSASN